MASSGLIGFIGLDEMSLTLVSQLLRSGYRVQGFEMEGENDSDVMKKFLELGGTKCGSATEAAQGTTSTIILIHENKINLIFRKEELVIGLPKDSTIILHSVLSPTQTHMIEKRLSEAGVAVVVDAHVFRGVSEASKERIVVCASGRKEDIEVALPVLSAMSEKVYIVRDDISAASKIRMVIELLEGIHLASSLEAIFVGVGAGIHPQIVYNIISNAAGSSWLFFDFIPKFLSGDHSIGGWLLSLIDKLVSVIDTAKLIKFPLPLLSVARQLLISGAASIIREKNDNPDLVKGWENIFGVDIRAAISAPSYDPSHLANQVVSAAACVKKVGFIGLGAMGFGMATHLIRSHFSVHGFDVYQPTLSRFEDAGGFIGNSPAEISIDVDVLVIMVANEAQAESVLYGDRGSVSVLPDGATIILSSTVSPGFVVKLEKRLQEEKKNLKLVDAPVSGGVKRAADGTLTIMASGTDEALRSAGSVLSALSENLYIIKGGCGAGSSVKMVNQLLAGVHIAAAAEAMAFGARMSLNTRVLFEVVMSSSGSSWMFGNRVPHILDNDCTPYSAVDIFVKDLGIVTTESAFLKVPVYVSSIAHQQFLSASASGWGRLDDSAVVKVYEVLTGVRAEDKLSVLNKKDVFNSLPVEWPEDPVPEILSLQKKFNTILVVLDDDPTGTQTVHDIEVLTEWSVESLRQQFQKLPSCFFVLTNSRALSPEKATFLIKEICGNLDSAAKSVANISYTVVLRGDSTLRGHFPEEADAAISVLGEVDAWIICPFFFQGGRYTIDDVHYVAESDKLIPAGETEFSKDASFGFKSSNLREWIEEKTKGRISSKSVASVSIDLLRKGGPSAVCEHLCTLEKGATCIVNAASERDVAVFAAGMIQAEIKGKRFLCRTAASFVSARIGIKAKAPISADDLGISKKKVGGLVVVGSYVPKTTKQVEDLKSRAGLSLKCVEVSVNKLSVKSVAEREEEISHAIKMVDSFLQCGKDTLLVTSRELVKGSSPLESLEINSKVSSALVEIVKQVKTCPRYILAKGGITSSDLATKALEARSAKVIGQALPGVPLWQLGPESRHPGVPYIVFPGNVGDNNALAEIVQNWSRQNRELSTRDLLINAEKGGYAVGAFNVYNLEGIQAVVSAAESERSPAILQIHPGALKFGGAALVACCASAAKEASVPITVHFDHGTSEKELMEILDLGFHSVMVDGSQLPYEENLQYTKKISSMAHERNMTVEAELGRLSGTEDGLTVEDYESRLTDPNQAIEFIDETGIDALAVCIGNVHGSYPTSGPSLKLDLLKVLHSSTSKRGVQLVLHGASGLSRELIQDCIDLGVCKFNVNTDIRDACLQSLKKPHKDLVDLMKSAKEAMSAIIAEKMRLFGSSGKA